MFPEGPKAQFAGSVAFNTEKVKVLGTPQDTVTMSLWDALIRRRRKVLDPLQERIEKISVHL